MNVEDGNSLLDVGQSVIHLCWYFAVDHDEIYMYLPIKFVAGENGVPDTVTSHVVVLYAVTVYSVAASGYLEAER